MQLNFSIFAILHFEHIFFTLHYLYFHSKIFEIFLSESDYIWYFHILNMLYFLPAYFKYLSAGIFCPPMMKHFTTLKNVILN